MRLQDWCDYSYYCFLVEGCDRCNLCNACDCQLHCGYETFEHLTQLPTKEAVDLEMKRMLSYRRRDWNKRGKYFWDMACDGRGTYERVRVRAEVPLTDLGDSQEDVEDV